MIVTYSGIVVFPHDPLYSALRDTVRWISLPAVTEYLLVRENLNATPHYIFISSCRNQKPDYYAIKEQLINDIRSKAEAGKT